MKTKVQIKLNGVDFCVLGNYEPGQSTVYTFANGDPGDPGYPSEFEIEEISIGGEDVYDLLEIYCMPVFWDEITELIIKEIEL